MLNFRVFRFLLFETPAKKAVPYVEANTLEAREPVDFWF